MKKVIFILFTISTFLFSSCGEEFQEVTFSGIENIKVIKLSKEGVDAEITAKIKNPNTSSFTVYKSDFDATINGINSGKARLTDNIKIKSKSEQNYVFKIHSDFSNMNMTDLPKLISMAMSKNFKIELKGNLKVGKMFLKKEYPISISRNVPLDGSLIPH